MKELLIVVSLNQEELDPTFTRMSFIRYASIHTSKIASINPITAPPTRLTTFNTGNRNRRAKGLTRIFCSIIMKSKKIMTVMKKVRIPHATGLTAVLTASVIVPVAFEIGSENVLVRSSAFRFVNPVSQDGSAETILSAASTVTPLTASVTAFSIEGFTIEL